MDDMSEYEKWKNTPGRLGILVSNGNFKRERRSEDETELFRAEFKERPRQIITKVIIGNPNSTEKVICNAIWDTGCTDSCISQTIVDELNLKEYGKKIMTDMTADHLCTFYIADIKSKNKHIYFSDEIREKAVVSFRGEKHDISSDFHRNGRRARNCACQHS